ncbi:MAG: hypothetical protein AAB855_01160, partial [Patescibacteria group bacterium]
MPDGREDSNRNGRVDSGETDPTNPDTDGDRWKDGCDPAPLDSKNPGDKWKEPQANATPPSASPSSLLATALRSNTLRDNDSALFSVFTSFISSAVALFVSPVFAEEERDHSGFSNEETIEIESPPILSAPTGFTATNTSTTTLLRVHLSWSDTNSGITAYQIQRKETNAPDTAFLDIRTTADGDTSYDDASPALALGISYTYRIRAYKTGSGTSDWVSSSSVQLGAYPGRPHTLRSLKIYKNGTEAITDTLDCIATNDADNTCPDITYSVKAFEGPDGQGADITNLASDISYRWIIENGDGKIVTQSSTTTTSFDISPRQRIEDGLVSVEATQGAFSAFDRPYDFETGLSQFTSIQSSCAQLSSSTDQKHDGVSSAKVEILGSIAHHNYAQDMSQWSVGTRFDNNI